LWQCFFCETLSSKHFNLKFFFSHSDDLAWSNAGLGKKEHKTVVWDIFCRNHGDDHLVIGIDHLQAAAKLETAFLSGVLLSEFVFNQHVCFSSNNAWLQFGSMEKY